MIKKYFFYRLEKNQDWGIMSIAIDKKAWLRHHGEIPTTAGKNLFYDTVAKRLLSQIEFTTSNRHIQIIVDKSKTQSALREFDDGISSIIGSRSPTSSKTKLTIHHRQSFADPGLQATDLFGWGIYRKHQKNDNEWYDVFKHRIALEMEFEFLGKKKTAPVM
jgi:hypothetical protein